jgi:hypothetical protein
MSIMNRRNAMLGWATWTVFKRVLKRNAEAEAAAAEEAERSRRRWRRSQAEPPPPEPKKRRKRRLIPFLAAGAVGVGVWLKTRGGRRSEPLE